MQYLLRSYIREAKPDAVLISVDWGVADLEPLLATVASIQSADRPVVVFGQVPSYQISLPRLLAVAEVRGDSSAVARARIDDMMEVDRHFARALPAAGVRYVSLYDAMCDAECASVTSDGIPLQFDESHFTEAGSVLGRRPRSQGRPLPLSAARPGPIRSRRTTRSPGLPSSRRAPGSVGDELDAADPLRALVAELGGDRRRTGAPWSGSSGLSLRSSASSVCGCAAWCRSSDS